MYIKRFAENLIKKALLVFELLSFEVYCRSDSDSPTRRYGESATPRLTDTESWRLPDSPMRGVGESTKGKIKALDLYVCLLLQASLVQLKHACTEKPVHFKFFSAVG
jgi:hypothetical protein